MDNYGETERMDPNYLWIKKKKKNPSRFIMNIFLLEAINVNLYSFSK